MHPYTASMPVDHEITRYTNLRQVLAPEYASLSNVQIEQWMDGEFGEGTAERYEEYLEGIFDGIGRAFKSAAKDVGKFAAKAAPVVAQVGGGALKGALAGAALGPVGIIGGAALGGAGTGLSKYGKGAARGVGGVLSGVTGVAGQFSPLGRIGGAAGSIVSDLAGGKGLKNVAGTALGAIGSALPGGVGAVLGGKGGPNLGALAGLLGGRQAGSAAGALTSLFGGGNASTQLMSLLQRPETMQALSAMALGKAGRGSVPVGSAQTPVPVSAVTNLIGQLANQAAAEAAALGDGAESTLHYMTGEAGEFVGDPALDRDRAVRVWELLNVAQAERLDEAVSIYLEAAEAVNDERAGEALDEVDESAYYDALEATESEIEALTDLPGEDYGEEYPEDYGEDLTESFDEWSEDVAYG